MGFGIYRRAHSRKGRGWFRRKPDAREVGDRFALLARRMLKDAVVRSAWKNDRFLADVKLVDGAPPLKVSIEGGGELVVDGDAAALGPGYTAEALARMKPILEELDYVFIEHFDLGAERTTMCAWLQGELRARGQVPIGIPDARRFHVDAPVLTALGPRDTAWRDAVLADANAGADAFPWWDTGPGRVERARALIAMWLEVPWREPLDGAERELMTRVDENLRAARKADASLELPWPDWKELLANLGIEDEDVNAHAGDREATIGYRRYELDVELSGGWRVRLPGAMVGHWEEDGASYWATDGNRVVEFTSLTADGEGDSDRLLAVAPEKHAVVDRFSDGARRGRAEAFDDGDVHVVVGLMAQAPHVGILTCKGGDEAWALATWRSLELHD